MSEIIYPNPHTKPGKIAVITPAGSIEKGQLDSTFTLLKQQGFEPIPGKHIYSKFSNGYNYGGNPKERLEDLQWALDGDFQAIWTSRGGYGCVQLLQFINLNKFKKNPKYVIGYSDVTVLQSYLFKHGFVSIHGQSIKTASFGVAKEAYLEVFNILKGKRPSYQLESNTLNRNGIAEGVLVGGNLSLIYSVLGSKFAYDFKDKILFIEDIGENYYALDRMLMGLEVAGVFREIKGLIVGGMTQFGDEESNQFYEKPFDPLAYKIVFEKVDQYDFPVAFGMPNGHIFENHPLIIGGKVKLEVKNSADLIFI